ncbi:hypothetical protein RI129_011022 [Pyrocoelia pectoralis]|uniref:Major facilitator superfamily (MFS) profile domain-containing protein n=1 Tax=Pyrocoelia pectoralis TaxID=417401 RepID=A0AAN7V7A9_9COLE
MEVPFKLEKRLLQYIAVASGSLAVICCGLHFGWTSPYLLVLLNEDSPIPMTVDESSWLGIIYLVGGLCGSLFFSVIGHLIGRKSILLWLSVPLLASWVLIALATTLLELLIARFIAGLCEGLTVSLLPIYYSEISDTEIRGLMGSTMTINFYLGITVLNILGSYLTIKVCSFVCASVPIILFISFVWMPESPIYLMMKGEREKAKRNFIALKGATEVDHNFDVIERSIEKENGNDMRFISLFRRTNRRSLLILVGLRFTQTFSGISAFTIYAQSIFKEGHSTISPLLGTAIFHTVQIIFSMLSSLFVDKLGRRPLLIASTIGAIVTLLAEGSFFFVRDIIKVETSHISLLPVVILIMFTCSYSLGLQTIPSFVAAEIFPANLKTYASTVSSVFFYSFGAIVSKYFQYTKDRFGLYFPFWSFAICCAFGLVAIIILVPETKNKTLQEIQAERKSKVLLLSKNEGNSQCN